MMGEARKRGTYEQRKAEAIDRQNKEMIEREKTLKQELRYPSSKASLMFAIAATMSMGNNIRNN